jgi:hypothetical protein
MAVTITQQPLSIPNRNLVLQLEANNTFSYPGTTNATNIWYDVSGNRNHFNINPGAYTNVNGLKFMSFGGLFGCAKSASGVDMPVGSYPYSVATIVTWTRILNSTAAHRTLIRALSSGGDHQIIVGGAPGTTYQMGMYDNTTGGAFVDSGYLQSSIPGYNAGTWNMLVYRFYNYSPYFTITLNNAPATILGSTTNIQGSFKRGICSIGAYNNGNQTNVNDALQYWGDIGSFYVYNRPITNDEVTQIYNATAPTFLGAPVQYENVIQFPDGTTQNLVFDANVETGGLLNTTVYNTAGSFTWTKPVGCTKAHVRVIGGGGGAAGYAESGGSGGYSEKVVDVTAISTVSVTVGAGGSCVTYYAASGDGGTSSFGSYCSATGGYGSNRNANHTGGIGGLGSGGDINLQGGGGTGHSNGAANGVVGRGGTSFYGGSTTVRRDLVNTKNGNGAPGTGGPGSRTDDGNGDTTGRIGEVGIVVVYAYR